MGCMPIVVRRPTLPDVDRLAAINLETWRVAYAGIVPAAHLDGLTIDTFRDRWRANLGEERPGVAFLVAEVDNVLSSYAIVGSYRPQQDADPHERVDDWGELYALYTHPELQGRGAGTALHAAALDLLAAAGYDEAALWVLEANESSQVWYAARGWRPDGATSDWTGAGEPLTEIRLRLTLSNRPPGTGPPAVDASLSTGLV